MSESYEFAIFLLTINFKKNILFRQINEVILFGNLLGKLKTISSELFLKNHFWLNCDKLNDALFNIHIWGYETWFDSFR